MSMCKVPRAPMNTERANKSTHWNWWSVHLGSRRYQDDKYVLWCDMGVLYLVEIVWVVVPNAANLPVGEPWNCLTNCGAGMCMSCSLKRVRTLQTENEWTNEPMKQMHFKDVLALFDWWQAFNVEICWFYCSNSMASVNVPPSGFVWWFACCSECDRKKGAETWQAGGHVFHVFASKNQRIAGVFQYCHWLKWSNWLILDHCFAPASKPLGQSWASLKAGSAHALCSSCLNSSLRVTFFWR